MSFISLAQAARRLGIDPKTLHRWLADAGLAVQPHPTDGRQKGLYLEQLHTLAQHHQRHLAPSFAEPPVSSGTAAPALLALSEQLTALEAQLGALQQQMADLIHLLLPPTPTASPASPAAPKATPSSARRSHAAATIAPTAPRKPVHVIPRVEWDGAGGYVVICPTQGRLALEPDSPQWVDWLRSQSSFRFVGQTGSFSAHHEWRVPRGAWRAHRKIRNHTYIERLAPTPDLTIAVLEQAAAAFQAYLS